MTLSFANGTFTNGKSSASRSVMDRSITAQVTNGTGPDGGATSTSFVMADLFGGELLLPDGAIVRRGMTFSGTTSGGGTFSGTSRNKNRRWLFQNGRFRIHQCRSGGSGSSH